MKIKEWATIGGRIEDFVKLTDKQAKKEIKEQYVENADLVYRGLIVYKTFGNTAYYTHQIKGR